MNGWIFPDVGARLRQLVPFGPFVVQRRVDMGMGSCRLLRHPDPCATSFRLLAYAERGETGLSCQVVHLADEADGAEYVVDTGICGPGLPGDVFVVISSGAIPSRPSRP